jgi:acyl-CoA synthetase (AMP-forming)/AMP-acid ligase II
MYTLGDIPRKGSLIFPGNEAVVFEKFRFTYRELNDRTNRLANALADMGYGKGDGITILADNCYQYLEVYFAASKLGMYLAPVNIRLADQETTYVVNDSKTSIYFVGEGYEERTERIRKDLENIKTWISLHTRLEGFHNYESLLANAANTEPNIDIDENEMAIISYTGGTTGLPKGVMLSHRNIMTAVLFSTMVMGLTPDDTECYVLPLFHTSSWAAFCVMMVGGKAVINRKLDLGEILRLIQDEKCTHINLVPTIYGWILQYPDLKKYDLSSLRFMTYAGSPFPPEVLKQCIGKFGNIFGQGYGATETSGGAITFLMPDDHILEGPRSRLLSSAGKPSMVAEVKIVDENGNEVKRKEVGEIIAKGKHVMMGYWNMPDLTKDALKDGWYHTGDMAYMDEEGFIFIVDRKADMIISGGENVYPKETEDVLYEHPAVMECAVVSAPDEKWGERVQAVVVLKAGMTATEKEIIEHCKGKLAGYKCPKTVEFWDSIPKTPIGKILRKDVKKHFWKGHDRMIR